MKASLAILMLLLAPVGAVGQQPAEQKPRGAMPALGRPTQATDEVPLLDFEGYFTGSWEFEWTVPESPLGPAGPVSGVTTYRSIGNSRFEAQTTAEGPDGPFTQTEQIEYQREQKRLTKKVTDSRGFSYTTRATVAGDLGGIYYIIYESEPFTANGRTVRLREHMRLLSPYNYRVAMTLAEGGGEFANYGNPWWRKQVPQGR